MTDTVVLIPYVPGQLHPFTWAAVTAQVNDELRGVTVEQIDVSGSDSTYWATIAAMWGTGRHLIIVEQDVEIVPGVLYGFAKCERLWCAHSYPIYWGDMTATFGGPYGLGCVRFHVDLQDRHPDLLDEVAATAAVCDGETRSLPGTHWRVLDAALTQQLRGPYAHRVHQHYPDVIHHHQYRAELTDEVRALLPAGHPAK